MFKYVAILRVEEPAKWDTWKNTKGKIFRSPVDTSRRRVEFWLEKAKKKYPEDRVNVGGGLMERKYITYSTILAYDPRESENVEDLLDTLIRH